MTVIRPSGAGPIAAVPPGGSSGPPGGAALASASVSAGLCEGFPAGPLSELLRYPDERQRSQQDADDLAEETAEALGLDFSDRAALARATAALVSASKAYADAVYRLTVSLLTQSKSDAPDVVHDMFGQTSWRDTLDAATRPLGAIELSRGTVQSYIAAMHTAASTIEAARQMLPAVR